jgi:hypothetical protein
MSIALRQPKRPMIDVPAVIAQIASAVTPMERALARQAGLDSIRLARTEIAAAAIRAALRRAGLDR